MNMEQRHDAERNIFFRKGVGVGDIRRRDREVEMAQRNPLRPSGASAGVQDEGDVVRRGLGCGSSSGSIQEMNVAMVAHSHRDYRDLAVGGSAAREFRSHRRAKQNTGIGVPEEKKKLLVGIGRVQRGSGSGDGGGEKTHDRRQSVG